MSVHNEQIEHIRALALNKRDVGAAYTVKTGRSVDAFIVDNPVDVNVADDYTLTVPAGEAMGQRLTICCSARTAGKTCTISVSQHESGDPTTFTMDAVDEYLRLIFTGTEWATISATVT